MVKRAVFPVVVAAMLLAGCGGGDSGEISADTSTSTTNTTVLAATVQQVASVVAEQDSSVREAMATIEPCFDLNSPSCTATIIGLDYLSAQLTAQTLALALDGIDNPIGLDGVSENPSFVGAIPAEVAQLHEETLNLANGVDGAFTDFNDAGCATAPTTNASCATLNTALQLVAGQLVSKLDAWQPYL